MTVRKERWLLEYVDIDITKKANFKLNMLVDITVNGEIKRGWISEILSSGNSADGIKVKLSNGYIGRIYGVPNKNDLEKKNFKFYNLLINNSKIYLIFYRKNNTMFVLNNQYIYLFSNEEAANNSIKNTIFEDKQFCLQSFQSVTKLLNYLEKHHIDYNTIIIDKTRQLSKEQFLDLYKRFYNC